MGQDAFCCSLRCGPTSSDIVTTLREPIPVAGSGARLRALGRRGPSLQRRGRRFGIALIAPTAIVMALVIGFPIYYAVRMSLYTKSYLSPDETFVGLENYTRVLTAPSFWSAAWNGVVYTVSSVTLQLVIGTAIAMALHRPFRGRGLARGLVLLPYVVPTVAAVAVWKWALNDTFGIVNRVLLKLHLISSPVTWLSPHSMMAALIVLSIWMYTPFVIVSVLARLQTMPVEIDEAARLDGANGPRIFVYITLPQLMEVFGAVVLLRLYWMFTKFDLLWLVGEGGAAGRSIENVPVYAFRRTFQELNSGEGAAAAVSLMLVLVAFSFVYLRAVPIERGSSE